MLTSAKNLAQCYLQIQSGATTLLGEAVQTGDLKLAWEVFRELQEVLPKLDWVPSRERYPEFRKLLDSDEFCVERYMYFGFADSLDEQANLVLENASDEEISALFPEMTREKLEIIMWEILHGGYSGFTYDW